MINLKYSTYRQIVPLCTVYIPTNRHLKSVTVAARSKCKKYTRLGVDINCFGSENEVQSEFHKQFSDVCYCGVVIIFVDYLFCFVPK